MRLVVQRVTSGSVVVDGTTTGAIDAGVVVLVGVHINDTADDAIQCADKAVHLRIFDDDDGRMNRSLLDTKGQMLAVSQFTLYGDTRKGRRPSFVHAAGPEIAIPLYERFVEILRERSAGPVETGEFGAMMDVELVNDGPVTLLLDSGKPVVAIGAGPRWRRDHTAAWLGSRLPRIPARRTRALGANPALLRRRSAPVR